MDNNIIGFECLTYPEEPINSSSMDKLGFLGLFKVLKENRNMLSCVLINPTNKKLIKFFDLTKKGSKDFLYISGDEFFLNINDKDKLDELDLLIMTAVDGHELFFIIKYSKNIFEIATNKESVRNIEDFNKIGFPQKNIDMLNKYIDNNTVAISFSHDQQYTFILGLDSTFNDLL